VSVAAGWAADPDRRAVSAAERQDWEALRTLVRSKADIRAPQGDGATALQWAAHWDHVESVDLLIRAGADVNAANDHGVTPLMLAAENGSTAVVARLLEAGANVNAALRAQGETPLMTAALSGNAEIVKMLLDRGAVVDAKTTKSGQTALMWATAEGHRDVVARLLERSASVHARSASDFTPMLFAAQRGHVEIGRMLVAAGASIDAEGSGAAPLMMAVGSGQVAFARFLLERGARANVAARGGETALHSALSIGGRRIGFDADAPVREPEGKTALIVALLARGADPNARAPRVALRSISGAGSGSNARDADNFGVGRTRRGATPFFVAAENADVPLMRELLKAGADPKLATDDKTTPLMAAAGLGHGGDRYERFWSPQRALEAVQLLIEQGVDVNAANEAGFTALHGTAFVGADAAAEYLVKHGANLNAQDFIGRTAYRIAEGHKGGGMSFVSRPTTVALLAKLGADVTLGPHFEVTERELAQAAAR
jgi:ankyrin repeat protein